MEKISKIFAREILDSRGDPTIEVELATDKRNVISSVPSGKSVGSHEAVELRDQDPSRFGGMGVLKAIESVNSKIAPVLVNQNIENQKAIDNLLLQLDQTPHKSKLGANAILGVSMAVCKATAQAAGKPLYYYISQISANNNLKIPFPMFKFIDGAKHAGNNLEIQEYMAVLKEERFSESYRKSSEMIHRLKSTLKDKGFGIGVGDEGGFAPMIPSDKDALDLMMSLEDVKIALDMAGVVPEKLPIETIISQYPIVSLEDPAGEDDFFNWANLTQKYSDKIMLVGDDVFATNSERLNKGFELHLANAVLVKPNQIGTVTEAVEFVGLAQKNNYKVVVSHRSGETEDTFIADFAVGVGADYVKFGAPIRGERVCKYNRLLRIEESLSD